eukprot:4485788-Karenia_brevis.AAC.1
MSTRPMFPTAFFKQERAPCFLTVWKQVCLGGFSLGLGIGAKYAWGFQPSPGAAGGAVALNIRSAFSAVRVFETQRFTLLGSAISGILIGI